MSCYCVKFLNSKLEINYWDGLIATIEKVKEKIAVMKLNFEVAIIFDEKDDVVCGICYENGNWMNIEKFPGKWSILEKKEVHYEN